MASRYRWRNISVFLSFNEDSSVGLLIGQQLGRQSIALCDKAIRGLQNGPARLKQEMLFHSNAHITGLRKTRKINLTRGSTNREANNAFNNRQIQEWSL